MEEAGPFQDVDFEQKTWCHIRKTVICIVSAMRTSYLTPKTKFHVPILLYNKPS